MKDLVFTVVFGTIGLLIGYFVAAMAWSMCGVGHGWCSPCNSAISIVGAPLAGIAWSWPAERRSLYVSVPALVIGLYSDFKILLDTRVEGLNYLQRAMEVMPVHVIFWAGLFVAWQIWAAMSVVRGLRQRSQL